MRKFIPVSKQCPHGYEKTSCHTCIQAEKDAAEYWQRQRDKDLADNKNKNILDKLDKTV